MNSTVSHSACSSDSLLSSVSTDARVNLLGMTKAQLEDYFVTVLNEKKFRAVQVMRWIHGYGVTDFELMTDLAKSLRIKLQELCEVRPPDIVSRDFSTDGTRKWVLRALDSPTGSLIETVLIPSDNGRKTLCISSQVGCALDCSFCSTGKQGFEQDLSMADIIGQLWIANQSYMEHIAPSERVRTVTNVVMMGMGEPLLNFEPVVAAMTLMLDDHGYGLSKRRLTLSTSGVVPMIDQLATRIDVALAISLHAPNNTLRDELVPINKKYPIETLIAAAKRYIAYHNESGSVRKHVTIEYVMLDGVNDSDDHALQLSDVLASLPCKINLIPFNPFPYSPYQRSSRNRIVAFQRQLTAAGYICTVRATRGDDIDAACGQLVGQVADKTRRSGQWQKKINEQTFYRNSR